MIALSQSRSRFPRLNSLSHSDLSCSCLCFLFFPYPQLAPFLPYTNIQPQPQPQPHTIYHASVRVSRHTQCASHEPRHRHSLCPPDYVFWSYTRCTLYIARQRRHVFSFGAIIIITIRRRRRSKTITSRERRMRVARSDKRRKEATTDLLSSFLLLHQASLFPISLRGCTSFC